MLPADRFTEIAYEDVTDPAAQTRRLLAFCGLTLNPRCLSFHENAAPVATAGSVQVRQPLHASSVGRWRRYGEGLEPMRHPARPPDRSLGGRICVAPPSWRRGGR